MNHDFDLLLTDRGEPRAIIEIENPLNLDAEEAQRHRRFVLDHSLNDKRPYFLVLSQDSGFLWKPGSLEDTPPVVRFSMTSVVERYVEKDERRLRGIELELLVIGWLSKLQVGLLGREDWSEAETALDEAGFLTAVRNSSFEVDSVA